LKSGNGTAYWGQTWMLSSTPHPTFGWPTLSTVEWPSCRAGYSPTPYYGSVPRCVK
jgi:hypothetical protein